MQIGVLPLLPHLKHLVLDCEWIVSEMFWQTRGEQRKPWKSHHQICKHRSVREMCKLSVYALAIKSCPKRSILFVEGSKKTNRYLNKSFSAVHPSHNQQISAMECWPACRLQGLQATHLLLAHCKIWRYMWVSEQLCMRVLRACKHLGRDMGGAKRMGGGNRTRTRSPENVWTPPKELLVCSVVDFCTGKTQHWHLRGVENVPYEGGGVQNPLLGGVSFVRFSSPLFFPPPHGVLWSTFAEFVKHTLWHKIIMEIIPWELFFVIFWGVRTPSKFQGKEGLFQGIAYEIRIFFQKS